MGTSADAAASGMRVSSSADLTCVVSDCDTQHPHYGHMQITYLGCHMTAHCTLTLQAGLRRAEMLLALGYKGLTRRV